MARFLLLLLAALGASAIPVELQNEVRALIAARDPPKALPEHATDGQKKFQPAMDFDTDGCYNTPAINAQGKIAPGLGHDNTGAAEGCHDKSDLLNNNVYVRSRCNNGWCKFNWILSYHGNTDNPRCPCICLLLRERRRRSTCLGCRWTSP